MSVRSLGSWRDLQLLVTLAPSFRYFERFQTDPRVAGIRISPPTFSLDQLKTQFTGLDVANSPIPLFYDVKGRQLRVEEAWEAGDHLECTLNHAIRVDLSDEAARVVWFKAGADQAIIERIDEGRRLIFRNGREYGPKYRLFPGESLHIRHKSLQINSPLFTPTECEKIALARQSGFRRYFLSYAQSMSDVELLQEIVGKDSEIWLKIESRRGLEFVREGFCKRDGLTLVAARGDLFVEIEHPHEIAQACRLIINKDPDACVGSRLLLSIARRSLPPVKREAALQTLSNAASDATLRELQELLVAIFYNPTPECADWLELEWLADIGYRRFLLCDDLCVDETLLTTAVNAFDAFRHAYQPTI